MSESLEPLHAHFRRIARIRHAETFLSWDQMVVMPPGGLEARSAALAELATHAHTLLTDEEVGARLAGIDPDSLDEAARASHHEMWREWQRAVAVPASLIRARIEAGARCEHGWRTQRAANDWQGFLENFRPVVELAREDAEARRAAEPGRLHTRYDALLDQYCSGDTHELVSGVFDRLRDALPPLLARVARDRERARERLRGHYPIVAQTRLNERLMTTLGFDFTRGRLDQSLHPFSTGAPGDHRITTRFRDDEFVDCLQSTAHETGHASYEAGLPVEWQGLPVGQSRNMSLHESQSVLFERHVLMNPVFLEALLPAIHECLPESRRHGVESLLACWHAASPGYIRVEADEVSYPLHVLLRYEIERDLVEERLAPDDLPDAWNDAMQRYLGISTADNHTDGCLQDIHWTDGSFGYFPSYLLGAVNAAQLVEAWRRDEPQWEAVFASGDIRPLRDWLSTRVWSIGCQLESQDIMRRATGRGTSADAFVAHLEQRYTDHLRSQP